MFIFMSYLILGKIGNKKNRCSSVTCEVTVSDWKCSMLNIEEAISLSAFLVQNRELKKTDVAVSHVE